MYRGAGAHRWGCITLAVAVVVAARTVRGDVNLDLRPQRQSSVVGQIVEIRLFASSDNATDQPVGGLDVVLNWDAARLSLLVNVDPCTQKPCPEGTYAWLRSEFPDDSGLDGLNDSITDGDAFYTAFARLGADQAAVATPEGLWVTSFRFGVIAPGSAEVRIVPTCPDRKCSARTRVADGIVSGKVVTGTLGNPATVEIVQCGLPAAETIGSRYISVAPGPAIEPVALIVEGDVKDPAVGCVSAYVQADGTLGPDPVFQLPDTWGVIAVTGEEIRPAATYEFFTNCDPAAPTAVSGAVTVTTWSWGDTDGDGDAGLDDVIRVIDGSQGRFSGDTIPEHVDLMPCLPDGIIDQTDINAAQAAFNGAPFPCETRCRPGPDLAAFAEFVACLGGPAAPPPSGCDGFDADLDLDVDLLDFAEFQADFGKPVD